MEMQEFSIGSIIMAILMFFSTCHSSAPVSAITEPSEPTVHLTIPKDDGDENKYAEVKTKLTLILLGSDNLYAYEGNDISKGGLLNYKKLRQKIVASKHKFNGPDFVVVIKPAKGASYKNTVDVLDEMAINNIQKYTINKLSESEKRQFNTTSQ